MSLHTKKNADDLPYYLTVDKIAFEMGVTNPTVYAWIEEGHLRAGRLPRGKGYRIARPDFDDFQARMYEYIDDTPAVEPVSSPGGREISSRRDFLAAGRRAASQSSTKH